MGPRAVALPFTRTWYDHSRGFATLYTAAYFPREGRVEYRWPDAVWEQSFDYFEEGSYTAIIGAAVPEAN